MAMRLSFLTLLMALVLSGQVVPLQGGSAPDKVIVLGDALAAQIEQRDGRIQDPALTGYVQSIADKLARSADSRLQVRLTRATTAYAVLLPRRVLYISSGLLLRMKTEGELAAILAHEQAHPTSLRFLNASRPTTVVVSLGNCILSEPVVPLSWANRMREVELQANMEAVRVLRSAHYDPLSLVIVFSKLVYDENGWGKAIVPSDLEMIRGAVESESLPSSGYVWDTSQFAAWRDRFERAMALERVQGSVTLLRRRP